MNASTLVRLSAIVASGPVGFDSVPPVAPSWHNTTITPTLSAASLAASAFTRGTIGRTWNGPRLPGNTTSGVDSVVQPTRPSFPPSKLNTFEGDHSGGVEPFGNTMFADSIGKSASGISCVLRYCSPRSKLWLPIASALKPIMFMIGGVGRSPKKFEIGGVAPPNESPPATVNVVGDSAR